MRVLIAASGTGGHIFPALAVAQQLKDYQIEWLGVPDRLEQSLVPQCYPLHTISVEGFQQRLGFKTFRVLQGLIGSILQVRTLLKERQIDVVFTTGGYIASPAILAARWLGLPVILHESNAIPGKVTRWFAPFCTQVALGFEAAAQYLPRAHTLCVSTPVRESFYHPTTLELPIPEDVPVIAVIGGSQGAVAVNQLVRQCAPGWLEAGIYIVHQTGDNDPDADSLKHPHYFSMPFYDNMAGLLQRANFAISRAGSGSLTELAVTHTPSILIPYPYAAEDHQAYNANFFGDRGAALVYRQDALNSELLQSTVLEIINNQAQLQEMTEKAASLSVVDSAERLGNLIVETVISVNSYQ